MRPVTVSAYISAPREEVFSFVGDLANHPAFTDHYLREFRLNRTDPVGLGASARFLVDAPLNKVWTDLTIVAYEPPSRIVLEGHSGRIGRIRNSTVYEFHRESGGTTRVELTTWTEPATRFDAFKESLGARGWRRRKAKRALERLREIFEERPEGAVPRATIAGYEGLEPLT